MLIRNLLLSSVAGLLALGACADERPRWEAGLGLAALSLPDYRGSDERRTYALPLPYFVYRGDILKADREGARAQLIGLDSMHVDLNVGASVPVSSKDNAARAGMPNLAGTLEMGPALDATLYESADERYRLKFRLPLSYGIKLNGRMGGNGWQAAPKLNLDIRNLMGVNGMTVGLSGGPLYTTRHRNAYFYDVAPQYVRANRPAYQSSGGYAGAHMIASLSKRFDKVWAGAFVRCDNLNGAKFADSPLVKTRSYVMYGLGVAWVMGQSSEMVHVD
jgi:outer membrane protein